MTLSLVAGIAIADQLFYQRYPIPEWLTLMGWGICLLTTLSAWLFYRFAKNKVANVACAVLTLFTFTTIGLMRYADYAEQVHQQWSQMERPPTNRGNPDEFDYRRWRWCTQETADSTFWTQRLRRKALGFRSKLVLRYAKAGLDDETLAIVAAVTLGDRSLLQRQTRDLYAAAGVSHLLALSGLHLGIIVGFFLTLMNGRLICSRWRPWLGLLILAFIWTYAFIAGLPTSLVRASVMTSLFVISALIQRDGGQLNILVLAALIMLFVRPVYLFDVGAQLSFAAVAGILILHHRWVQWAFKRWRFQFFWLERYHLMWILTILSVSIAAQVFTLPLVAYYFHRIPLYAPLFNLVMIPLTTVLIYSALLLLFFTALLPSLAAILSVAISWLVAIQLGLMKWEVNLPNAIIKDFWSRKAEPQVVFYNNRSCPALHVIASPDRSWLLMPIPDSMEVGMKYIAESFWQRRLTSDPIVLKGKHVIAVEGGFKAVMVDDDVNADLGHDDSFVDAAKIDVLWLTKGFRGGQLGVLTKLYNPRLLVLDARLARWQREALKEDAVMAGWRFYDIAEQGALKMSLETTN